jgi:hypothetical protein
VAGSASPSTGSTAQPVPLTLAHVLEDDGFLLCRYTSSLSASAQA